MVSDWLMHFNLIIKCKICNACILGCEPVDLTVHPPPPNDRGWVHSFRMGV